MSGRSYSPGELIETEYVGLANGILSDFRGQWSCIPPGEFLMGSPKDDHEAFSNEKPQHKVTLTRGFMMLRTPVTQEQWRAVMGTDPSQHKGVRRPVEGVPWSDAVKFCNTLSRMAGLPVSYRISSVRGYITLMPNPRGFRLPTEAEWEYACRAGTTESRYHPKLLSIAWPFGKERRTHAVGQKTPNAWNLYDMLGNVREWCEDREDSYPADARTDPVKLPSGNDTGDDRMTRGGRLIEGAFFGAAANRRVVRLWTNDDSPIGFRPVLSLTWR